MSYATNLTKVEQLPELRGSGDQIRTQWLKVVSYTIATEQSTNIQVTESHCSDAYIKYRLAVQHLFYSKITGFLSCSKFN